VVIIYLRSDLLVQIGPLFSQVMPMMEASPVYSAARNASGYCSFWLSLLKIYQNASWTFIVRCGVMVL
jgi:hypothetical protein